MSALDDRLGFEQAFWRRGFWVAGCDEVGRGPLAGPVVAAAVVLNPHRPIPGVDDSKRLSPGARSRLAPVILEAAAAVGVAFVGPREIERVNIREASRIAMRLAVGRLSVRPDIVLTDALPLDLEDVRQEWALIGGDRRSASVAAASVVAKVMRDRYMEDLARQYPVYGFSGHKGYPTPAHIAALLRYGPCDAHRWTFIDHLWPESAREGGSGPSA